LEKEMDGKFAVFLAPGYPQELLDWAVTDAGSPYLRCSLLEDALGGFLRIQVEPVESTQRPGAVLLVQRHHIAFVLEGSPVRTLGFSPR